MQKLKRAIEELLGCSYQPKLPPQRANKLPPQPNCLMTEHQWEHDAAAMERFFAAVDANGKEAVT